MPEITVIIPTYKPKQYIESCLKSLKNQNLSPHRFEIIIVLNGGIEPWKSYINKMIEDIDLKNAILVCENKGGVSNARNIGITKSHGKNIVFIDDDDYVSESYLSGLLKNVTSDAVVLSNSIAFNDETGDFIEGYAMQKTYNKFKSKANPTLVDVRAILNGPCMKMIPLSVISGSRFDESFKNGEDGLFMFEISKNISSIKFAPETSIYYRRFRSNSAVTSKKTKRYIIFNACRLINAVLKRYFRFPLKYNFRFMITRVLGPMKGAAYELLHL